MLIELQISEPVFRMFVAYAYYMKNLCTILGVVRQPVFLVNEQQNIYFSKELIPPYKGDITREEKQQDQWFNATTQSHNCIMMDNLQLIIS